MKDNTLYIDIDDIALGQDFKPEVRITKWEGEVGLNVSLRHDEQKKDVTAVIEDNKVKWKAKWTEAHFYELPADADHPGGSYEFEIIYKKKPLVNYVDFDIATYGLDFRYQDDLTPEEIAEGCIRPDNVVHSYAVYHATKTFNEYKAGKAFHIYRPKAIDANGIEEWCEIEVDTLDQTLRVTVPQKFIDDAAYPIRVDPTFGKTDIGATLTGRNADIYMGAINTSGSDAEGATLDKMTLYTSDSGDGVKAVLVENTGQTIVTNGVSPAATTIGDWVDIPYTTKPTLSASTEYQLGIVGNGNWKMHYDSGSAWRDASNSYATPTNPSDGSSDTKYFSVYATYTAAPTAIEVTPDVGALVLAGFVPTITASNPTEITLDVGALTLTGYAPTVAALTNTEITPDLGALTLTGFEPTMATTSNVVVTPGLGEITLTGYVPTATPSDYQEITLDVGALTFTGYAPTVAGINPTEATPDVGALTFTGLAPIVSTLTEVYPDNGVLTLAGYAPTVAGINPTEVTTDVGALTLTGYVPTITIGGNQFVEPDLGELTFTGYAPSVVRKATMYWYDGSNWIELDMN